MSNKWDERFMEMAALVSTWSKDPSKQIGAVAVKDRRVIAQGYNGLPQGFPDTPEFLENREVKYEYVIHAEENVIINAAKSSTSLQGSTVYVYGLPPCSKCSGKLVNAGVVKVVYTDIHDDPRWKDSCEKSKKILEYGNVVLKELFSEKPDDICTCGHPRSNHPYRHPFVKAEPWPKIEGATIADEGVQPSFLDSLYETRRPQDPGFLINTWQQRLRNRQNDT